MLYADCLYTCTLLFIIFSLIITLAVALLGVADNAVDVVAVCIKIVPLIVAKDVHFSIHACLKCHHPPPPTPPGISLELELTFVFELELVVALVFVGVISVGGGVEVGGGVRVDVGVGV